MGRKRILIVDDSATSLLWQGMILARGGVYDVLTARDGQGGIDTALAEQPDLILMDVAMPGMGGYEACRALRTNDATAAVPVIMVSTKGESGRADEGRESGCNDHITKPIDKLELLAKVKSFLGD